MRNFALLVLVTMQLFFAENALADDTFCHGYADDATRQQVANTRDSAPGLTKSTTLIPDMTDEALSCGFSGPRWTSDWDAHYQWCVGRDIHEAWDEENARDQALYHCGRCRLYAKQVIEQIATEQQLKCRLTGARWQNTDGASLFQWCMSQSHSLYTDDAPFSNTVNGDVDAGKSEIDACRAAKLREKLTVRRPSYPAIKIPADAVGKQFPGPSGTGESSGFNDPHCDRCKTRNSAVKGPDQPRGSGSAMDRLGDVNNNLGSVSGNSGGAQLGRPGSASTAAPPAGAAPAGAARGSGSGMGAIDRLSTPPTPRFDNPNALR